MVAYYRWRTTMMKERIALIAIAGVAIGYGLLTKASGQATTDSYVVVAGEPAQYRELDLHLDF
jgi:hypothetical protein